MNKAYITILSSANFEKGVAVLYNSLRRFSEVPFVVLISKDVDEDIAARLRNRGMIVMRGDEIELDDTVLSDSQKQSRWNNTLFKLRIFGMEQYDKIVYLDSDLLIRKSIDDLFDKPDFSAVPDFDFIPSHGRPGINAGVFCFTPSAELEQKLTGLVAQTAGKYDIFGDQDVINEYLSDWDNMKELHLLREYNACFYALDPGEDPRVAHFIFADKPWMWSGAKTAMKMVKWALSGQSVRCEICREYMKILKTV